MSLDTNLVSYWKLDESSGNASDSVGSNTLTNEGTTTFGAAKINNGATFDGSTQALTIASDLGIGNANITMSAWMRPHDVATYSMALTHEDVGSHMAHYIQVESSKIKFGRSDYAIFEDKDAGTSISNNTWYHFVYVYDGSYVRGYVNGVAVTPTASTATGGGTSITADFTGLGRTNHATNYEYDGDMDEVGVWSRALTADEISQLYNSNRALAYPLTAPTLYGGVAYWKLDESSGDPVDSIKSLTLTNGNTVGFNTCKINNGADFGTTNTNKTLRIVSDLGIAGSAPISFSGWLKVNTAISASTQYVAMDKLNSGTDVSMRYLLYYGDSLGTKYVAFSRQGSGAPSSATYNVDLGTTDFHHIVGVWSGGTGTLYVDGVSRATFSENTLSTFAGYTSELSLGAYMSKDNSTWASAKLDEFGVFNRALTSTEVTALYNSGAGLQYPFTGVAQGNFFLIL